MLENLLKAHHVHTSMPGNVSMYLTIYCLLMINAEEAERNSKNLSHRYKGEKGSEGKEGWFP